MPSVPTVQGSTHRIEAASSGGFSLDTLRVSNLAVESFCSCVRQKVAIATIRSTPHLATFGSRCARPHRFASCGSGKKYPVPFASRWVRVMGVIMGGMTAHRG